MWPVNELAHAELRSYIGPLFWTLGMTLAATTIGGFRLRRCAFRLAAAILCAQVAGDFVNLARGDFRAGVTGVPHCGASLACRLRSKIRPAFYQGLGSLYRTIAPISTTPSITQNAALRFSPAPRYPAAALKHRIALVHPLAQAAGLLNIFMIRMMPMVTMCGVCSGTQDLRSPSPCPPGNFPVQVSNDA